MTPLNMAKHRNNPHFAFWKMLKQGYDHFEVSRLEPKVSVCDRRYVFDAQAPDGRQLRFDPAGRCPAYEVNQDLRDAVAEKQRADETQFASLVQRGTPTVAVRTGRDGGMHQTFLAKLTPRLVRDADGTTRYDIDPTAAAKLGTYVNPPRDPDTPPASTGSMAARRQGASTPRSAMSLASTEAKPPQSATRAGAPEQESTFGRIGSSFSRWVGLSERSEARSKARPRAQGDTCITDWCAGLGTQAETGSTGLRIRIGPATSYNRSARLRQPVPA